MLIKIFGTFHTGFLFQRVCVNRWTLLQTEKSSFSDKNSQTERNNNDINVNHVDQNLFILIFAKKTRRKRNICGYFFSVFVKNMEMKMLNTSKDATSGSDLIDTKLAYIECNQEDFPCLYIIYLFIFCMS
jgi:hypothetical protein